MKPNQNLFRADGTQVALYPMKFMKITQGMNQGISHRGRLTLDDAGKDSGIDNVYAPFDCKVVWKQKTGDVTGIVIQSLKEVWIAKGIKSFVQMVLWHDNDTKDLDVGKIIKQGEVFYQEGTAGFATGNHLHYGCSLSRYTGGYPLVKNEFGNYEIKKEVSPIDVFFINDTEILKSGGYDWREYTQETVHIPVMQVEQVALDAAKNEVIFPITENSRVKITGTHYATGQLIPASRKLKTYTVSKLAPGAKGTKALLKEIVSWVYVKDLVKV